MAAARDDGSTCGVGAAYRAQLSAIAILQYNEISDADEARALSYRIDINDIYSNSWGPTDDGNRKEGPKPLTAIAMEHSIRNGRNGLGSVYVWSSGNGRRSSDSCNYDGYANWRYTITVGAVDYQGIQAWYSEACAAIHFVTPSSGSTGAPRNLQHVISSDLLGSHGLESGDCNTRFSGTSAACPLAAGVVALVLQARPDLNWIELQQILIDSTVKNNPTDSDWAQNAAGRWFNHKYGFGLINATQAVMHAERWNYQISLTESIATATVSPRTAFASITGGGFGVTSSLTVSEEFSVRHVEVYLTASTLSSIGSLKVVLTAPSGTIATLADKHGDTNKHYNNWRFTSLRSWGETSKGVWTLTITDVTGTLGGELTEWRLSLYGGESIALPPGHRIIPRPSSPSSSVVTAPVGTPSNMTSGVSRSVPNRRIILLLISAVPLVILGVWAGYSKIAGKNVNAFLIVGVVALFITIAAVLPWSEEY
jgi:subtilisin-like proprotein convertase family protein